MSKYGANLPAVLNPPGEICVEVYIPAHPDYIKLFLRAIRMLEVQRMYARDESMTGAKTVVEQWRNRTITPLIEALATGTGLCQDLDGECLAYPPFASFISYFPQNPYTEPDLIPEGFEQPPFFVNGKDPSHDLPNYNRGDVLLDFGSINIEPSWDLEKTPRIELCLEGSGVAEIHFLNIVQGGVAIVSLDNPVDLGDIIAGIIGDGIDSIDLNQDIISLPPETAEEIIIEIEVPTEGEHILYIYFLPTVNDSLIPLAFGGGLREISLCGNLRPCGVPPPEPPPPLEGITELKPEFQFTPDCGMEYRLRDQEDNIVQDWQPVPGWVDNAGDCFGGAGMSIDYDALKNAIRDGMYEFGNDIAKQIVSGRTTDIAVGSDGTVTDPTDSTGGEELPPDDPGTEYDETAAAEYGGTLAICRAVELFWDKIDAYYGNVNGTPALPQGDTQALMKAYFPIDEDAFDLALTAYYLYRSGQPQLNINFTATNYLFIYCKGSNETAVNQWLIDSSGFSFGKITQAAQLINGLAPEFWSKYMAQGIKTPSTSYLDAPCVPIAPQTLTGLVFGTARSTTPLKASHRMLMKVKGYALDVDGDIQDWFWYRTAAGVNTRSNAVFTHGAGGNQPSDNQVVYSPTHEYEYTIDLSALNAAMTITPTKNANMNATGLTYPVPFEITLEDLGEYTV